MRECVDHWRLVKNDDGAGGFTRDAELENANLRVAWEERPPVNTITGDVLSHQATAEMGLRRSVDVRAEDLIVHNDTVYRVIGARVRLSSRWQIVALELRDEREVPQQAS